MSDSRYAGETGKFCYGNDKSARMRALPEPTMAPIGTSFIARIAASPVRIFTGILALHATVWTALPALLYPNLPLDLIEALLYGREWQLGYDKLPPLPWWLVDIVYRT